MGYSYQIFAVDFGKLEQFRKGDQDLYQKLAPKCKDTVESVQEYLEDGFAWAQDDDQDGGGFISTVLSIFGKKKNGNETQATSPDIGEEAISGDEALRHLIIGGDFVVYGGTAYGYLLESICEQIGESLDNNGWSSMRSGSDWDSEIAKALKKSGVNFPISEALICGSPIPYPPSDDFPYVGHFTPDDCKKLSAEMASLDIAGASRHTKAPEFAEISLNVLKGWVDHCSAKGFGLITFYY